MVGDVLLDRDVDGTAERLAADAPVPVVPDPVERRRPGGAGLAAALLAGDGAAVTLIAALADDDAGRILASLLARVGVDVAALPTRARTGEKIRVCAGGRPLVRLDHGGPATPPSGDVAGRVARSLAGAGAVLVADYGRGVTANTDVRAGLQRAAASGVPVVWDPHPRGARPVSGVTLATPNQAEARRWASTLNGDGTAPVAGTNDLASVAGWARALLRDWDAREVCVTLGRRGAMVLRGDGGAPILVAADRLHGVLDPCGAGDRFAGAAARALAGGVNVVDAVRVAVHEATAFVAAGGAGSHTFGGDTVEPGRNSLATPMTLGAANTASLANGRTSDAWALADRVRSDGGTLVATGGCFDIVHAGHVQTLSAARRLGDALIVCLNSDASVRHLKGPNRPVNGVADRAAVLASLACVDGLVVFDDPTPESVLDRLRPDVWVKGGDYAARDLPEARIVEAWGGKVVVLPYLNGRSTSAILDQARMRGVAGS